MSNPSEECGVCWLGEDAPCMLAKGHEQTGEYEHFTRIKWRYENGEWGEAEVIWRAGEEIDFL